MRLNLVKVLHLTIIAVLAVSVLTPAFADHGKATVDMPEGTGVPGCEVENACFVPYEVTVDVGGEVTWTNSDTTLHFVSAGDLSTDPNMVGVDYPNGFDSGIVNPGTEFSHKFEEAGTYQYFCTVHPWMKGIVYVEGTQNPNIPTNSTNPITEPQTQIQEIKEQWLLDFRAMTDSQKETKYAEAIKKIEKKNNAIANLKENIEELKESVKSKNLNSDTAELVSKLERKDMKIDRLENKIDELKAKVEKLQDKIKTKMDNKNQRIDSLKDQMNDPMALMKQITVNANYKIISNQTDPKFYQTWHSFWFYGTEGHCSDDKVLSAINAVPCIHDYKQIDSIEPTHTYFKPNRTIFAGEQVNWVYADTNFRTMEPIIITHTNGTQNELTTAYGAIRHTFDDAGIYGWHNKNYSFFSGIITVIPNPESALTTDRGEPAPVILGEPAPVFETEPRPTTISSDCTQEGRYITCLDVDENMIFKGWHDNGQMSHHYHPDKNGRQTEKHWHYNGTLKAYSYYDDKGNQVIKNWHDNGQMNTYGYTNEYGKPITITWNKNGNVVEYSSKSANDHIYWKNWYDNGQMRYYNYVDENGNNREQVWDKNGNEVRNNCLSNRWSGIVPCK